MINKSKRQQQQQQHPKEDKEIKLSDIDFNFEKLINSSQKKSKKENMKYLCLKINTAEMIHQALTKVIMNQNL